MTGFLGPGLDAGPIIARTDSYQSIWIGSLQLHLFRHAVVQSASSNRDCWLLTHATLFMVCIYCTREYLRPFTNSDETSWCWPTLIAVFQRGRVSSYQLSVFGFQIVAVFGRIRIVHLAHYSVRFEFESNIRYSPNFFTRRAFFSNAQCYISDSCCVYSFFTFVLLRLFIVLYHVAYAAEKNYHSPDILFMTCREPLTNGRKLGK